MGDWTGRLLVATPLLTEATFHRTVVLLLQADPEDGALGLVLNRPTGTEVGEVLASWGQLAGAPSVVFTGGPVQPNSAICLGHGRPGAAGAAAFSVLENAPGTSIGTVDLDADPPELAASVSEIRVFAGYAGWSPGQLEAEVAEGAWWVIEALPTDAFCPAPEELWKRVLRRQPAPLAFAASYPDDPGLN